MANQNFSNLFAFETVLQQKGAVFNGTSDDTAAVQAALDTYASTGSKAVFPANSRIRLDSELVIHAGLNAIDFGGSQLLSGVTNGFAIRIYSNTGPTGSRFCPAMPIENFVLVGPDTDAATADGIYFGTEIMVNEVAAQTIRCFKIEGFRDNIVIDSNAYMLFFQGFQIRHAHRRAVSIIGTANSSENCSFVQGAVVNSNNADNTAVGFYIPYTALGPDLFCHSLSLDYNDTVFDIQAGVATFDTCHWEDSSQSPMGKISSTKIGTTSYYPTHVRIAGGSMRHGPLGGSQNTEPASGRPILFQVTDLGNNQSAFEVDGLHYKNNGRYSTEFCNVVTANGAVPMVRLNMSWEARGINGRVSGYTNLIANGDFEVDLGGWTSTGGGVTITRDTSVFNTGAASAKIVVAGPASGTYKNKKVYLRPGERVLLRSFMNVTALAAGQFRTKVWFYDGGDVETGEISGTAYVAVTSGFQQSSDVVAGPAGTQYALVGIEWLSTTGTAYLDTVEAWVL